MSFSSNGMRSGGPHLYLNLWEATLAWMTFPFEVMVRHGHVKQTTHTWTNGFGILWINTWWQRKEKVAFKQKCPSPPPAFGICQWRVLIDHKHKTGCVSIPTWGCQGDGDGVTGSWQGDDGREEYGVTRWSGMSHLMKQMSFSYNGVRLGGPHLYLKLWEAPFAWMTFPF